MIALTVSALTLVYLALYPVVVEGATVPEGLARGSVIVAFGLLLGWCLVSMALAVLVLRGSPAARIALLLSSAVAGSVSLTVSVLAAGAVLTLVACVTTFLLLLTKPAREWFRMQRAAARRP